MGNYQVKATPVDSDGTTHEPILTILGNMKAIELLALQDTEKLVHHRKDGSSVEYHLEEI